MPDPITLVAWEPWELDGDPAWRCTIETGHGTLSWTTRYGPVADALTVEDVRVLSAPELFARGRASIARARLRAALPTEGGEP
jgi:hypothetical protein